MAFQPFITALLYIQQRQVKAIKKISRAHLDCMETWQSCLVVIIDLNWLPWSKRIKLEGGAWGYSEEYFEVFSSVLKKISHSHRWQAYIKLVYDIYPGSGTRPTGTLMRDLDVVAWKQGDRYLRALGWNWSSWPWAYPSPHLPTPALLYSRIIPWHLSLYYEKEARQEDNSQVRVS